MDNKQNQKNNNAYFNHMIRYQKIYLPLLLVLIAASVLFTNYAQEKPLLMGGESYYYLSLARGELPYHPLTVLFRLIPEQVAFLFPPLLSLATIFLFYALSRKLELSEKKVFFIVLGYLLTPTFLFSSATISAYLLYLFLVMLGTHLLLSKNKHYFAIIPFALAACIDTFTALMLLAGIVAYYFIHHQTKEPYPIFMAAAILALTVLNYAVLNTPFFLGPYLTQKLSIDLISDLGALSGVGFFMLFLALIGIVVSWEKRLVLTMGPALAVFIASYLLNTQTVFFLSLFIIVFAAIGIEYLLEQQWRLSFLRNAVLLLLILGLSFSTVSYLERISSYSPTAVDHKMLRWIEEETDDEAVILSAPENSYYISYFAKRQPALNLHQGYRQQHALAENIFSAFYIDELFPLLEASEVSIVYVSEDMKHTLPPGQEFLFLLQNERFKMLNSTEEAEVWSFEEARK